VSQVLRQLRRGYSASFARFLAELDTKALRRSVASRRPRRT
jgi:hypothetical protein